MTTDDGMDVVVTETPSATIARQAAEIERLRTDLLTARGEAEDMSGEIERLRQDNDTLDAEAAKAINGLRDVKQEIERLRVAYEQERQDCINLTEKVIPNLRAEIERLRDVLVRAGFVRCDIPACNCDSWHHRYGLPERWDEIKQIVEEAGHPLTNANGHVLRKAVQELISAKDAEIERLRTDYALLSDDYKQLLGDVERLRGVIDRAAKAWLSLEPGVAWEGDVGGAMKAAVAEIERLRGIVGLESDDLDLDWDRLRSGDQRALIADHQDVFNMMFDLQAEIERLRELLLYAVPAGDAPKDWLERVREELGEDK